MGRLTKRAEARADLDTLLFNDMSAARSVR